MSGSTKLDLSTNQILADLLKEESVRLLPHLQFLSLRSNEVLRSAGGPMRYAYFPQDAMISLLAVTEQGVTVEVGLIGYEGMLGICEILGAKTNANAAVVQIPGGCLRVEKNLLQTEFNRSRVLQDRLHRYARYRLAQVTQTAACNRVHRLDQRLCRWLLMAHNRAMRDDFPMTHEFLGNMLGTPRSEVTRAAGILRKAGFIRYQRGDITILDRKGLESAACECYQIDADELNNPR